MSTPLVTRTVTVSSQGANGLPLSTTYELTGNAEFNFSESLAIGTNIQFSAAFKHANVLCMDITASSNMTVDFNSTGSPAPSISTGPTAPAHWDVNQYGVNNTYWPNPFTADITTFYVTNAAAGTLNISILLEN